MKLIASVALAVGLSGCVQATRHSNTMVFGTNTSVGLKVGTDVSSVPGIQIGYNRQEAVILPLLANTSESNAIGADGLPVNRLVPCSAPDMILGPTQSLACQFSAVRGDARDSYSALASFGADIGSAQGGQLTAQVGLAQYFATGMAAQLLAATGGASIVNTSSRPPVDGGAGAAAALFGSPAQLEAARRRVASYQTDMQMLESRISAYSAADKATMMTKLAEFETTIRATDQPLSALCRPAAVSPVQCAAKIDQLGDIFIDEYSAPGGPGFFAQAIGAWAAP